MNGAGQVLFALIRLGVAKRVATHFSTQ